MEGQLCLKSLNDICSMFSHEEHVVTDSNNCPFVQNRISQKDNLEGFYIPSFQRGYRWTTLEVKQLVQDLARLSTFASKTPAVAGVLLVGLHYTAFRDAIREDSRQTTPSRGVTQRKKFAVEANVESRVS